MRTKAERVWHEFCEWVSLMRSREELSARSTKGAVIIAALLAAAIVAVLAAPSPRGWRAGVREKPELFQLMETDYIQPMLASAHGVHALNAAAEGSALFGGYDEFVTSVKVASGPALANVTRFAGETMRLVGATLLLADKSSGGPRVFLSEDFWEREFGRDESVVGKPLFVNGFAYRIAGVARKAAQISAQTDLWMPVFAGEKIHDSPCFRVIGAIRRSGEWKELRKELAMACAASVNILFASHSATPRILPVERGVRFGNPQPDMLAGMPLTRLVLAKLAG